jgi:hypothetical protein
MGWVIGWTELSPLATDKFQQWLQQHGAFSAGHEVAPVGHPANGANESQNTSSEPEEASNKETT